MCDVNRSFQSMCIEKTYPKSVYRSARLVALCKRPEIEELIERLTDVAFLTVSLATQRPALVMCPGLWVVSEARPTRYP